MIDLTFVQIHLPQLLYATLTTLKLAFLACCVGTTTGVFLGILQTRKNPLIYVLPHIYATAVRGTPMLMQILLLRYGILPLFNLNISPFYTAVIAIGINNSAYVSQIIRTGILAVGRGQKEAAFVLGFSTLQTIRYVILPQAIRKILPALGNEFILIIRDTSLASSIGVLELITQSNDIIALTDKALPVYLMVGLIYLAITSTLAVGVNKIYRVLNKNGK